MTDPLTEVPSVPAADQLAVAIPEPEPEPSGRPEVHLTPRQWIRKNLFATWGAGIMTVIFGVVLGYLTYRFGWFLLVSSDWQIIRRELRSFMVGSFPEDEVWRLWAAIYVATGMAGLFGGAGAARSEAQALAAGRSIERATARDWLRRYWPALVAIGGILSLTRTPLPALLTLAAIAGLIGTRLVGRRLPQLANYTGQAIVIGAAMVLQLMTGPLGPDWAWWAAVGAGGLVLAVIGEASGRRWDRATGLLISLRRILVMLAVLSLVQVIMHLVASEGGVEWDDWGGFHLTVFVTIAGIALSFPLGVLVALGRRSSLPVVRWINLGYIELIRGVPLITLLFMGRYVVPLLYPNTVEPPSHLVRALIVITLFEGAYVAETVRGGLQSIPRGQYEAAQAIGLSQTKVTRLIVLPQALRAVIPAMVGQFISLFKDTALLGFIAFSDFLEQGKIAAADTESLLNRWHAVIYTFIALVYWAGSYTMSRESRRLERRLGIGERR